MQSLDIISVNIWQILVSLLNLLLIFFILKRFLFKPVEKMLKERQSAVDEKYNKADEALKSAENAREQWSEKIGNAQSEADDILRVATENADRQSKRIIGEAKNEAGIIIDRAKNEAILEKRRAEDEIKSEIVDVSAVISQKILEREINSDDHKNFIDEFISNIGEGNDSN